MDLHVTTTAGNAAGLVLVQAKAGAGHMHWDDDES
jgi:hypothetical protein